MIIEVVVQVGLAFLILSIASAAGATILRCLGFEFKSILDHGVFSAGLGISLTSYLIFGFGTLGWLGHGMIVLVLLILLILGFSTWTRIWTQRWSGEGPSFELDGRHRLIVGFLISLVVVHALFNLLGALAPPSEPDSLTHHLGAVKHFVAQGRISFVPYRAWAAPFTSEMWNLFAILLGTVKLAQLFVYSFGLLGTVALYRLGTYLCNPLVGLLAGTLYYTSVFVSSLAASAKSDLLMMLFVFLSARALFEWCDNSQSRWLVLSGIFAGLAAATKYQGLIWLGALGLGMFLIVLFERKWSLSVRIRSLVSWGLVSVIIVAPWWVRNWLHSGDPLWPYGFDIFQSAFWNSELAAKYSGWTRGPGEDFFHYVGGLWNLTNHAQSFSATDNYGVMFSINPLPLALLPGLALVWSRLSPSTRWKLAILGVVLLSFYTVWFLTYQHPRYLLPVLALLGIPTAIVFERLFDGRLARRVATLLMVLSFTLTLALNVLFNLQFFAVVTNRQTKDSFLKSKVSYYEDVQWVNENLSANSKLLVFPLKTFYFDVPVMRADRNLWDYKVSESAFVSQLRKNEITHIFLPHVSGFLSEYGFAPVLEQLQQNGRLRNVYHNARAVQVKSRTLGLFDHAQLDIFEVIYPQSERVLLGHDKVTP